MNDVTKKVCRWIAVALGIFWTRLSQAADNQMFNEQRSAFQSANSGSAQIGHTDAITLISSAAVVLVLVWFAWVVLNAYKAWGAGVAEGMDAGSQVLRALFVMLITMLVVSY